MRVIPVVDVHVDIDLTKGTPLEIKVGRGKRRVTKVSIYTDRYVLHCPSLVSDHAAPDLYIGTDLDDFPIHQELANTITRCQEVILYHRRASQELQLRMQQAVA